jgi:hypothetical protein
MMDDLEFAKACDEFTPPEKEFTLITPEKFNKTANAQEKQPLTNKLKKIMMYVTGAVAATVVSFSAATTTSTTVRSAPPNMEELGEFFGEIYDMYVEGDTDFEEIYTMIDENKERLWYQYQEFYNKSYYNLYYMYNPKTRSLTRWDKDFHTDEEGMIVNWWFHEPNSVIRLDIIWNHFINDNFENSDIFAEYGYSSDGETFLNVYVSEYDKTTQKSVIEKSDISTLSSILKYGGYTNIYETWYLESHDNFSYRYILDDKGRFIVYDMRSSRNELFENESYVFNEWFNYYSNCVNEVCSFAVTDYSIINFNNGHGGWSRDYNEYDVAEFILDYVYKPFLVLDFGIDSWSDLDDSCYVLVPFPEDSDYETTIDTDWQDVMDSNTTDSNYDDDTMGYADPIDEDEQEPTVVYSQPGVAYPITLVQYHSSDNSYEETNNTITFYDGTNVVGNDVAGYEWRIAKFQIGAPYFDYTDSRTYSWFNYESLEGSSNWNEVLGEDYLSQFFNYSVNEKGWKQLGSNEDYLEVFDAWTCNVIVADGSVKTGYVFDLTEYTKVNSGTAESDYKTFYYLLPKDYTGNAILYVYGSKIASDGVGYQVNYDDTHTFLVK